MASTPGHGTALPGHDAMVEELDSAPAIYRPSGFWRHHAELQRRELEEQGGFDAFKRTVNRHFFQFNVTSPLDPQFRAVAKRWLRRPDPRVLVARLDRPLPTQPVRLARLRRVVGSRVYAVYIAMLARFVAGQDRRQMLAALSEPQLGQPVCVHLRGRAVSEDICNSALEYASIADALPSPPRTVVELGSGYGRLAWVLLRAQPDVRYVLVDIPPGLAIAQRYLTDLLPDARAFRFRHFDDPADVADELRSAQIVFLTPNQLELLPSLAADLFVNVSSLHEMSRQQIAHYFQLIDRHCDGCFYTKQWLRSVNPFDELVIGREDYPVNPRWTAVFDRRAPVQTHFFEALYEVGSHDRHVGGEPTPAVGEHRLGRTAPSRLGVPRAAPVRAR
jgi:putative sugar O-methyltransferase